MQFLKLNPICDWPGCDKPSTDIHHHRGKVGRLLCDDRHFKSVCRHHHHIVHSSPAEARKAGMLCEVGQWNTYVP